MQLGLILLAAAVAVNFCNVFCNKVEDFLDGDNSVNSATESNTLGKGSLPFAPKCGAVVHAYR